MLSALLPRLRRFGLALTGSAVEADELVQDACARALQREGQLRDQARLDAWLYGIMRNLWIDEIRARSRRRHEPLDVATEVAGDDGPAVAEGRITLELVRRRLQEMPAEHRTILVLVCVDGLSYREAAEVLGIAIGTVMSRLSRARRDLAERLGTRSGGSVSLFPGPTGRSTSRPM
ncbi:MAG TPA: RNA polymerase sigma factor [Frateuria sp.]|uniref:RNA polymerase sigma factor n=1 Tax=Frateuria sp. TaxID=2211372 RepID=UPI002D8107E4|nr:RNA polymerase sigma factor [Frateuria sp.]HET6806943.1 RNA polymerase sigma factor [Frateuria sp.]